MMDPGLSSEACTTSEPGFEIWFEVNWEFSVPEDTLKK